MFKFGIWGPFSLSIQIVLSYVCPIVLNTSPRISFIVAVIVTIQINYIIASKFIFDKNISFKYYIDFLSTSGLARLVDIIIFILLEYILFGIFLIGASSIIGTVVRFLLYEKYVFKK